MRTASLTALTTLALGSVLVAGTTPAVAAHGGLTVTGLTVNDRLVTFTANAPEEILSTTRVTGVAGDLQSIDFRPATGDLYGVGVEDGVGTIYTIDTATGAATEVPGSPALPVSGEVSIDVNPVADALRIVDSTGTNLRVPFGSLALVVDGTLAYAATDAAAGTTPSVSAAAYTNSVAGATSTALYDLDAAVGNLVLQAANPGTLTTVGALPQAGKVAFSGFDIYKRETALGGQQWAFVSLFDKGRTTFYEIDLATGAAKTFAANPADPASGTDIGSRPHVTDIALAPAQGV